MLAYNESCGRVCLVLSAGEKGRCEYRVEQWGPWCRVEWKGKKKKKKEKQPDKQDLYGLLGLHNERWTATDGGPVLPAMGARQL